MSVSLYRRQPVGRLSSTSFLQRLESAMSPSVADDYFEIELSETSQDTASLYAPITMTPLIQKAGGRWL